LCCPTLQAHCVRVQFTADQGFVDLLSEARDLLWHRLPDSDLVTVQRLALEALVARLRRKYAATLAQAQTPASRRSSAPAPSNDAGPATAPPTAEPRATTVPAPVGSAPARGSAPRRRVPAAVRREVWQRDGGRCSFVERGSRVLADWAGPCAESRAGLPDSSLER
jgi:hypothetical protein